MLTYVIPTKDRPERLRRTLMALAGLGDHASTGGAEVIVIDNASRERSILPRQLKSGVAVREIRLATNEGAAARNRGVAAADPSSAWVVMLDDDSFPDDTHFPKTLAAMPPDVAAVSADIFLPPRPGTRGGAPRESGGLPEVFIGCGVAFRRAAFLDLGGYDPSFNYYAEEYDLAARIIRAGYRTIFSTDFTVQHAKDPLRRDMNLIVSRLVRNNGWVASRYAPAHALASELKITRQRYRAIARVENALDGYGKGLLALRHTIHRQSRTPLDEGHWERFTGLAAARAHLHAAHAATHFRTAAIVDLGKNAWVVAEALRQLGVKLVDDGEEAEALVIGTMSPGPMLDALERRWRPRRFCGPRLLAPWMPEAPGPSPAHTARPAAAAA